MNKNEMEKLNDRCDELFRLLSAGYVKWREQQIKELTLECDSQEEFDSEMEEMVTMCVQPVLLRFVGSHFAHHFKICDESLDWICDKVREEIADAYNEQIAECCDDVPVAGGIA
tara:strand:- start:29 stop:370 length:342 start_codon:yes stop_codon:yes gene_type:complete